MLIVTPSIPQTADLSLGGGRTPILMNIVIPRLQKITRHKLQDYKITNCLVIFYKRGITMFMSMGVLDTRDMALN